MATVSVRKNTFSNQNLRPARRVGAAQYPRLTLRPLVAALAALGLAQPTYGQQLPQGPAVVNGSASIGTNGSQMTITNSPNAILNWQNFSIGAQNGVRFQQENSASQVLNRVTGNDPSQILGSLSSNGRVWLINPNGVLFGQNARIDVAGMVASTLDIANADFLAGRYNFVAANGPNRGEVMNKGEIRTTFGGRVWLLGEQVKNEGLVETPGGQIVLAAGKSIELIDSGMPNVIVRVTAPENEAINLGTLVATGGSVDLHAGIVNQSGIVRATGVTTDANGRVSLKAMTDVMLADGSKTQAGNVSVAAGKTLNNRGEVSGKDISLSGNQVLQQVVVKAPGGNITLTAQKGTYLDGSVDVSNPDGRGGNIKLTTGKLEGMAGGTLNADGQQGGQVHVEGRGIVAFSSTLSAAGKDQGGTIEVTGDKVYLLNADVNASGGNQGGTVHLGGGWQGSGNLSHANEVMVGLGSEVKANGGRGGEIAVWSTKNSEHYGSLQAKGGGRIELSSKGVIRQTGDLQTGPGGSVLLDPKNLIVTDSPPDSLTMARKVISFFGGESGDVPLLDGDTFGSSVALDGDRLAIGAPGDDTGSQSSGGNGAVHLFTGVGVNFTGLTWQKKLASGIGAASMPTLSDFDNFGAAVALNGDRLAVGAPGTGSDNEGAVHLFTGVGLDFTNLSWRRKLASSNGPLIPSERFGSAVALDADRLVVGSPGNLQGRLHLFNGAGSDFSGLTWRTTLIPGDGVVPATHTSGFGSSIALSGDLLAAGAPFANTVHLFTGLSSNSFSGVTWRKEISSETGAANMPVLSSFDNFGASVSLNDGRLVVGAPGDGTQFEGGGPFNQGAVHLFTSVGADFSNLTWVRTIRSSAGAIGMPVLSNGDWFGSAVSLDHDRLAVGAAFDGTGGVDRGGAYLFTGVSGLDIGVTEASFGVNPSGTSYIKPASIEALLSVGTAVTLQANNDITILSPIVANEGGSGGDFILRAGRNIGFSANITTDNGNLTAVAGDSGANAAFRDPGTPTMTIDNGVTLNLGLGTATLAAVGGNFVNNNGNSAITNDPDGGRWLIYAANPATTTEGFTSFNKHYNQEFIPSSDPNYTDGRSNWFLYSLAPTLSVTPSSQSNIYGNGEFPITTSSISGFIDGDNSDTAGLRGFATWDIRADGATSSSGNILKGSYDIAYVDGLSSDLGYQFTDNTLSRTELTVTAKALTASSITALDKVYDGTTAATLTGGTLSGGVIEGDFVSLTGATGSFDTKNVGNNKTVTISGGTLAGSDAGNYSISGVGATTTADVTPRSLTASYTGNNKVYDGTVSATVNGGSANIVAGDVVNFSQLATFTDKNVGAGKTINVSGIAVGGTDAANYALSSTNATTSANITAKSLNVGSFTAQDKIYDATTTATVSAGALSGIISGDTVSLIGLTGNFDTKNVGNNKIVSVSGVTLSGTDAGNYTLSSSSGSTTADITPKTLSVSAITALDKIYDGTTFATLSGGTLSGVIAGDNVNLSGTTGTFDTKNVGTNKTVTIADDALSGSDAGNYAVSPAGGTATADITPKALSLPAVTAQDKVYDGNTVATLNPPAGITGVIPGDAVSISSLNLTGTFDTKSVGTEKIVTISATGELAGADSGNYYLNAVSGTTTADITKRTLTASAITALDKVYDGTTAATLSGGTLSDGIIAGDVVSLSGAIGNFDSKNVGVNKTVTVYGGTLAGTDAGNYSVTGIPVTTTADITPRSLTASYSGNNKVYDGTVVATVNGSSTNIVAGDVVNFSQTTVFANKNAGVGKTINISGIALSGTDATNYALSSSNSTTNADITAKSLTAFGLSAGDKGYDGTTVAGVSGGTLSGVIVGDAVNISSATGTFDNKNVGVEKPVAVTSISLAGADAGNYTVAPAGAVAADVTPATLIYVADPIQRASTPPSGLTGTVVGFKDGDSLANATTGAPIWTTPATPGSPRGAYRIEGGGLTAGNYVFVQAPNNSTALTLFTPNKPDLPEQQASNDAINSITSTVKSIDPSQPAGDTSGKFLALSLAAPGNRVSDLSTSPGFGSVDLSSMSRDEMTQLIDLRREFKKKLFADAIYKLEVDPSLAEVPECANTAAADSGLCRMSDTQRQEAVAKLAQANPVSSSRKVKEATLPEIQRKIVVAFGINNYVDPEIQPLDNAVLDAKAVSKAFAESLGYEVRIVENPTKADIIRTLNQLSTEIQKNDSVIVYYAGHGFKLDETGLGYWIPSDGSADDPKNWISNTDVSKMLGSIGANQVAVISDSCYSGAFAKEKSDGFTTEEVKPSEILSKRSVVVMSSGGDEPVVDAGGKGGHSIFATQLMETIQGVDKWQAGNNIFEAVQAAVHKKFPQQPQYGAAVSAGHQTGGDYLFEFRQLEGK